MNLWIISVIIFGILILGGIAVTALVIQEETVKTTEQVNALRATPLG